MLNFDYYSPTKFIFGKGKHHEVAKYIKEVGGTKVLFHYGSGSIKKSGLYDSITKSLNDGGIEFVELGGVVANPKLSKVYEGIELCKKHGIDLVLAVGGGSVIDSAKLIALGALYEGDVIDFFNGLTIERALPVATVLTISAAGSEGSRSAVATIDATNVKCGVGSDILRPKFSILNPELTFTLPKAQIAYGVADMMAHIFERYFTNTKNVTTTDYMCEGLLKTIIENAPILVQNPQNYEAAAEIMWCGVLAHNNICGVGREQDWASHGMEHQFSALYDIAHGAGLAIIVPAWMSFVLNHDRARFTRFARTVFNVESAEQAIESLKEFFVSIGLPIKFSDLNINEQMILDAIDSMPSYSLGKFVELDKEKITTILLSAK